MHELTSAKVTMSHCRIRTVIALLWPSNLPLLYMLIIYYTVSEILFPHPKGVRFLCTSQAMVKSIIWAIWLAIRILNSTVILV